MESEMSGASRDTARAIEWMIATVFGVAFVWFMIWMSRKIGVDITVAP